MADSPPRKRPVAASRTASRPGSKKPSAIRVGRAATRLDDEAPTENYALRLTEALEAISSIQDGGSPRLVRAPRRTPPPNQAVIDRGTPPGRRPLLARLATGIDMLPPIRLPVGPAISWRIGLPALIALVALVVWMSRPSGYADAQPVRLPTPEPYPVQQEAPLFTNGHQPIAPTAVPSASAGLGLPEPASAGFDAADIAFKLIAVLALAYGSLWLLKRFGFGGAAAGRAGGMPDMRVVSSLVLAPNRTVHVLRVPGGKTLLVGATPNQVNLIADLGEVDQPESPESTSFVDVLKSKL